MKHNCKGDYEKSQFMINFYNMSKIKHLLENKQKKAVVYANTNNLFKLNKVMCLN